MWKKGNLIVSDQSLVWQIIVTSKLVFSFSHRIRICWINVWRNYYLSDQCLSPIITVTSMSVHKMSVWSLSVWSMSVWLISVWSMTVKNVYVLIKVHLPKFIPQTSPGVITNPQIKVCHLTKPSQSQKMLWKSHSAGVFDPKSDPWALQIHSPNQSRSHYQPWN